MIKLLFTDMSICFEPIQKCGGKGNGCDVIFRYGHDLGSRCGGGLLRRSAARRLGGGFQHPGLGLDVPADFKQMNEFVKHD